MWKPRSSAARATSAVSVKQWKTPPASPPCFLAQDRRSVSAEALRVWMTSGRPLRPRGADVDAEPLALPLHLGHARARPAGSSRARSRRSRRPCRARAARRAPRRVGSRLSSSSGWTPALHQKPSLRERQRVDALELVERRADAQGAVDARRAHRCADFRNAAGQLGRAEMTVRIDEHGAIVPARRRARRGRAPRQAPRRQIVCVGLTDEIEVPRVSSIRARRARLFSSVGKRTPTPCVRPPEALAGVIQPTLPATG